MKQSEDIVKLIKSLSKSEKRYFKVFVKNNKGKNKYYIELFNLIDQQGTSLKKVIKDKVNTKNFEERSFKLHKYRLYNLILKSLNAYHADNSNEDKILELIRQTKRLFDKNLYSQATKTLEKAKSIAAKYEKFPLLLELNQWEKKIIMASSIYEETNAGDIKHLAEEERLTTQKVDNANEYWELYALMYIDYRISGGARMQENGNIKIINKPILKDDKYALSYSSKRNYYAINILYYDLANDLQKAYEYAKNQIVYIESKPDQIEENPITYTMAVYNLLTISQYLKKYEEFFKNISKLKSLLKKFPHPLSFLIRFFNMELMANIEIGHFRNAIALVPEIEALLNKEKDKSNLLLEFFILNKATLYFGIKDYQKALFNLNEILNKEKIYLSQEHYSFVRMFQVIIHFEKGNLELLPYLLKSLYRYLLQRKNLFKIESLLIKFFKTEFKTIINKRNQIIAFKILREELLKICSDAREARFLESFDVISWLESKIENKSFEEVLRKKSRYTLDEKHE